MDLGFVQRHLKWNAPVSGEKCSRLVLVGIMLTGALLLFKWNTFAAPFFVEKESPGETDTETHHLLKNFNANMYKHKELPGIIGIGCKKCGTGAFRRFVKYHSRVKTTKQAETFFFDDGYKKGTSYYKSLMKDVLDNEIAFEKTANYFTSKVVPQRITNTYSEEMKPTPKFVLVVCDPVQRAFSDFTQAKNHPEDLIKLQRIHNFTSFEEYVEYALKKTGIPTIDTLDAFYSRMDELLRDVQLHFLLRGVYSYYLQHWLKTFQRRDFVLVDGDLLLTNPGQVMVKAQRQLGLKVEIWPENFVFVPAKEFYCVQTYHPKHTECLGQAKGNTRKVEQGVATQTGLSENCTKLLQKFYAPFLEHFKLLASPDEIFFTMP